MKPIDTWTDEELHTAYLAEMHGMQSGVAAEMQLHPNSSGTDPKHLRFGVNSAMMECSMLVKMLMDKGIFTEREYRLALYLSAKEERERYEKHLSEITGKNITLQ